MGSRRKKKKKTALPPRVKRMNRAGRLASVSATAWLEKYKGKSVLRGYCKHFGVNWRCAAAELEILGVKLDPGYLARREQAEAAETRHRKARRQQRQKQQQEQEARFNEHWHPYTDPLEAYLAGDNAALHDLELQRDGAAASYRP